MNISNTSDYPSVTVVMISLNDEKIIDACLSSIRRQDYPQDKIAILMVDGGSTDKTLSIASKYSVDVLSRPDLRESPDIRGGIALTSSRSDLTLFFSADNRFKENNVLSLLVAASIDPEVVACETLRYGYRSTDPVLSRYFALIGGGDPIAVGLGKADRVPHDCPGWCGFGDSEDKGFYYKVSFPADNSKIPTIGANGFLIKNKYIKMTDLAGKALHIDMCVDLILKGHNKFAFIKGGHVIHYLDLKLANFLRRRILYAKMYENSKTPRIYSVFHRSQWLRLMCLVLANLTCIWPLIRALKGFFIKPDIAWFLNPLVSFAFTVGYGVYFLKSKFFKW